MPVVTVNGNKYVLKVIDDYSIMFWAYLFKDKSQVLEFKKKII